MEASLANALKAFLEDAMGCDSPHLIDSERGVSADNVDIKGPYISFAETVFYVELNDGKTYTITVNGA